MVGFVRWLSGSIEPLPVDGAPLAFRARLSCGSSLRAFSGGCSAMTGTEAISNAVPAFKPPESAQRLHDPRDHGRHPGLSHARGHRTHPGPPCPARDGEHGPRQPRRTVYGGGFFYYALQIATMAILVLAANTSYAGFPRLSSRAWPATDSCRRQFMNRGDKLVFSNGIIGLTVAAIVVLVAFGRKYPPTDPALRGGSLHQLHAVSVGDGGALVPAAARPGGSVERS